MHGLYSKHDCCGRMTARDQQVKNVKFALMGNFSLWKAFARPMSTIYYQE